MNDGERYIQKCEVLVSLMLGKYEYDPELLEELVEEGFVTVVGMVPYLTDKGSKTAPVLQEIFTCVDSLEMPEVVQKERE